VIVICAHPAREQWAYALASAVGGLIVWDEGKGEVETHYRAWSLAGEGDGWSTVIEDDAVVIPGFTHHLGAALAKAESMYEPAKVPVVSCYTGTSRPDARIVKNAVDKAAEIGASWLVSRRVYWGVCLSIQASKVASLLARYDRWRLPSDQRISEWAAMKRLEVLYTQPSMVNHRDATPIIQHRHDGAPRTQPRVAHRFDVPGEFNDVKVAIR
jgi:hypothetical protein